MEFDVIPIVRIFDEDKAKDFYLGFLGLSLDWEHRFEDGFPLYMQVSRAGMVLHLSEHSGDCSPGSKLFVNTPDLQAFYEEIVCKGYEYSRPEISDSPWGTRIFEVTDPFSNKILFNEVNT